MAPISLAVSAGVAAPSELQSGWSNSHCHSTPFGGIQAFVARDATTTDFKLAALDVSRAVRALAIKIAAAHVQAR